MHKNELNHNNNGNISEKPYHQVKTPDVHEIDNCLFKGYNYFLYVKSYADEACVFTIEYEGDSSHFNSIEIEASCDFNYISKKWKEIRNEWEKKCGNK